MSSFDLVCHQRLTAKLAERVSDRRLLVLIGRMLKAKVVLPDGVVIDSEQGVPQGSPLTAPTQLATWRSVAVTQPLERRPGQARAGEPLVLEDQILRQQQPPLVGQLTQPDGLALDRLVLAFLTDQDGAEIAKLEARHRQRARVEDCIRNGKDTGMRNLPHHAFAHNQTWLELSVIAQDLLCWLRLLCLDGKLALAEPKRIRHRLLHVAGRIVHHGRQVRVRLQTDWPWASQLTAAFARLRANPQLY